jgi:hypothetical protein
MKKSFVFHAALHKLMLPSERTNIELKPKSPTRVIFRCFGTMGKP